MAKSIASMSECASVVARFAEDASLVVELATICETFQALCEEHALAAQAVQRASAEGDAFNPAFFEYLGIIRDLEHEIATAIANQKRSLRHATPTAVSPRKRDASLT